MRKFYSKPTTKVVTLSVNSFMENTVTTTSGSEAKYSDAPLF